MYKMSCKINNSSSKNICDRFNKQSAFYTCKHDKIRCNPVKKVIQSRKLEPTSSSEVRSCSTGVIEHAKKFKVSKPRRTTQSDIHFNSQKSVVGFCSTCGDCKADNGTLEFVCNKSVNELSNNIETQVSLDQERSKNKICDKKKLLQQYYKNENFKSSVASLKVSNKKINTLAPIKESLEGKRTSDELSKSSLELHSDSVEELGYLDPEDEKNIKNIKDFRKDNYFECHSAKARVSSKGSVTSLINHKCLYRFYLNDRLFPVPLNNDHQRIIRCAECHLPLEMDSDEYLINGTIQTKVKLGNEIQDLTIMLPVKKPLIVQEKRTLHEEEHKDVLYFGIVKLNYNGDSIFKANYPNDSLALKYQKGYKEFINNQRYMYEKVEDNDVIII